MTERRIMTRSMSQRALEEQQKASSAATLSPTTSSSSGSLPGIRCLCQYLNPMSSLSQCGQCSMWFHPECLGIQVPANGGTVRCPECNGSVLSVAVGRKRARRDEDGEPEQVKTTRRRQIVEYPNKVPSKLRTLENLLEKALGYLKSLGCEAVFYPTGSSGMTKSEQAQCLDCCSSSIANATFSASYPKYCISELANSVKHGNKYMQGVAAKLPSGQVVSCVMTNGMDAHANLAATVRALKDALKKGIVKKTDDNANFLERVLAMEGTNVDDFVHITLIATHDEFRGRGLAKTLLIIDLIKWALRGRTRSFVNMAFEKCSVKGKTVCSVSIPSRRLYSSLGFAEVIERYDDKGNLVWTKEEADLGRCMANLDIITSAQTAVKQLTSSPKKK